jgi:hypothetical protein
MTTETLASAIAVLRDAYPRADFPDASVQLYGRMLAAHPGEEVAEAVKRLVLRSTFLPSIAEIVEEIAEARLGLPSAAEALEILEHGSLKEAPAEVRASAKAIGGRYSYATSENPTAIRAQFRRDYEERRAQAIAQAGGYNVPRELKRAEDKGDEILKQLSSGQEILK